MRNKIEGIGIKAAVLLVCSMFVISPIVIAADTDTINVSFTLLQTACLTVEQDSTSFGNLYVGAGSSSSSVFNVTNCGDAVIRVNASCNTDYFMNGTDHIDIGLSMGMDRAKIGVYSSAPYIGITFFGEDATQEIEYTNSLASGASLPNTAFQMAPPTSVTVPTDKIYNVTVEFKAIGL